MAECIECGRYFYRPYGENWRVRCVKCWLDAKGLRERGQDVELNLRNELMENLKPMLGLCHPDRHQNSEASNRVTAWLLSIRDRIGSEP